jgi:para-nitrobenzyl esterase
MKTSLLLFLSFLSISFSHAANDNIGQPVVETKQGKVRGTIEHNICVWRGIRYAQAQRFCAPKPAEPWAGVKEAIEYGAIAPQSKSNLSGEGVQSEDCLNLNIWSPAPDDKKRPVMFWIHGGGFIVGAGSSPLYRGTQLAKNGDVVVVTINYRLGPLGFLYFNNTGPKNHNFENNLGIRDQIAALQWVKDNIAAFGGDPNQVTIFGESAGGTSVETLLATPSARGLFKGAIAESGPPAIVWQPAVAEGITKKYCSLLHISPDSIYLLKNMPLDTLKAAEDKLLDYMVAETSEKVFAPSVDGQLLTSDIFKCMKPDLANEVALMIGTNRNEITMFASKKLKMAPHDAKGLEKYFDQVSKEGKPKVLAGYENYPRKSAVLDILTDAVFRIPAIRLAECRSMYSPVYMYRFEWTSFFLNVAGLRSFHGLEIPFVFGNTDGKVGKLLRVLATKKTIRRLSGEMQRSWVNFARYGNPNGTGTETWKKYDLDERTTMIFDKKSSVHKDPDGKQRKAWEGVSYY